MLALRQGRGVLCHGAGSTSYTTPIQDSLLHFISITCASFLSRPQKTWTMLRVAAVTGSEKSPPGGETAPTMVTLPFRIGLAPAQVTLPARS